MATLNAYDFSKLSGLQSRKAKEKIKQHKKDSLELHDEIKEPTSSLSAPGEQKDPMEAFREREQMLQTMEARREQYENTHEYTDAEVGAMNRTELREFFEKHPDWHRQGDPICKGDVQKGNFKELAPLDTKIDTLVPEPDNVMTVALQGSIQERKKTLRPFTSIEAIRAEIEAMNGTESQDFFETHPPICKGDVQKGNFKELAPLDTKIDTLVRADHNPEPEPPMSTELESDSVAALESRTRELPDINMSESNMGLKYGFDAGPIM